MANFQNRNQSGGGFRRDGGDPRRGGGSGGGQGGFIPKTLPDPESIKYFKDGKLDPDWMDAKADAAAQSLRDVAPSQLRRFYDDVLNVRQRIQAEQGRGVAPDAAFDALRADFKMLKAKAVYANGRSKKTFPDELLKFFINHVAAVDEARDFDAFCKHFQAVVAFHKFYVRHSHERHETENHAARAGNAGAGEWFAHRCGQGCNRDRRYRSPGRQEPVQP